MKELSKEDKERVELQVGTSFDKISFEVRNGVNPYTYRLGFIGGAKYEHPIAFQQGETKGFNEGIEAAIKKAIDLVDKQKERNVPIVVLVQHIQKLKKK